MRNRYTALFAAVFALSMITGCGGSESADKGTTASAQPSAEQSKGSGLRGEAAPTFKLKDLAGADVAVEAKGKPYIINFWATWCPPCQAEIPDLAAFHAAHKDTVDFYAVNLQEDAQPVQKFMAERKVELPVVLDTQISTACVRFRRLLSLIGTGRSPIARPAVLPKRNSKMLSVSSKPAMQGGRFRWN